MGAPPPVSHYSQPAQLWMNQGMTDQFGRPTTDSSRSYHQNAHANFSQHPPMNHPHHPYGPMSGMMPPPPPPLMMPSQNFRPLQQNHHMNPPPPTPMMGAAVAPPFPPMPPFHHQPQANNDDSVWQDPDGSMKKWQRDTGTALWGEYKSIWVNMLF